jgi:hypothetical protein
MRQSGTEYGFVISGELVLTPGFDEYQLNAGDSARDRVCASSFTTAAGTSAWQPTGTSSSSRHHGSTLTAHPDATAGRDMTGTDRDTSLEPGGVTIAPLTCPDGSIALGDACNAT